MLEQIAEKMKILKGVVASVEKQFGKGAIMALGWTDGIVRTYLLGLCAVALQLCLLVIGVAVSPALADGRDGIHDRLQHPAVMHVGARQRQREGDALRIGEDVTLRAGLASICRVRARRRAPFFAAIEALSREARLKSMPF